MNLKCISHKEYGYTIVVDMTTRKEVELDYEFFPCGCSYPARLVGVSCYCESYKCDKCGKSFTIKQGENKCLIQISAVVFAVNIKS